ncbi:MAG: phage tail family protein [Lachnospiraceae bacterium]|nr:phage tail family protein [Lachnospiraceae bacterium]
MALYRFTDTTEIEGSRALPSEAMSFNGVWLEEEIEGYRTLYVTGREIMNPEITELERTTIDGNTYRRRRYKPRTLVVGYQLLAPDAYAFRKSFEKLLAILSAEEAQIIFHDEPDRYYTGTISEFGEVPPGTNSITASFSIYCADPFKYDVNETEVEARTVNNQTAFDFIYDGTYKAFPVLKAQLTANTGRISYTKDGGEVITVGQQEKEDSTHTVTSSTVMPNASFSSGGTPSGWTLNGATIYDPDSNRQQNAFLWTKKDLAGNNISTVNVVTNTAGKWSGAGYSKLLSADSFGHYGAKNFQAAWHIFMGNASSTAQTGVNQFAMIGKRNGAKYVMAAIEFLKNTTGNYADARLILNGSVVKTIRYQCTEWNEYTGQNAGHCRIYKTGAAFTFGIHGKYYSFTDADLEEEEATEVSVYIGYYQAPMDYNGLYNLWVVSYEDETTVNASTFTSGEEVEVDTGKANIYLNGAKSPQYGNVANDFEGFALTSGRNKIVCDASDWALTPPNFTMVYRRVFL